MSGRVGDLSKEQEAKLKEFCIRIQDVLRPKYDEYFLLRWLRARKFDVNAAENMLRKCLKWRESVGADTILNFKFPEIAHKHLSGSIIGHDKEGCPVWLIALKDTNINEWCATEKLRSLLVKYIIFCQERIEQDLEMQSKKLGKRVEQYIDIRDYDGVSISQIPNSSALKFFEEVVKIHEEYYPDRLKVSYTINLPRFLGFLIPFSKLFLSTDSQKKMKYFTKGADWKSELLKEIDPSELPKHWGGTKVDPDGDPKCPSIVRFGSKLPKFYYNMSIKEYLSEHPDAKTAVISRSSSLPVEVVIEKAGSLLEWYFMTENRDIGFGLFFKGKGFQKNEDTTENGCSNDEEIPLIPIQRVQSHLVQESGVYQCDIQGIYTLKFDNSYSRIYVKKLYYNIGVVPPAPEIV